MVKMGTCFRDIFWWWTSGI